MVQFLYTAQYLEKPDPEDPRTFCLLHHVQVYCLADRCSIKLLKGLVISHLDSVDNYFSIVDIQDLVAATKYAYGNTAPNDKTMKDFLIVLIIRMMDYGDGGTISNLMMELAEVGHDVARALRHVDLSSLSSRRSHPGMTMYACKSRCGYSWLIQQGGSFIRGGDMPLCPCCERKLTEKEEDRGCELLFTYKCQTCDIALLSDWNYGEPRNLFCNHCGRDGLMSVVDDEV